MPSTSAASDRVVVMENHDAAYHTWRQRELRDRILIHIDAHHDLAWRGDDDPLGIGNFICPAMTDGLVRTVYWVVPDPSWSSPTDRDAIARQLERLIARYPEPRASLRIEPHAMTTTLAGVPITVCALDGLPAIDEPVLLDIDADYLVVAHVYHESDAHLGLPWCWPDDLVSRLTARNLRAAVVTMARSVEGGYTPLKWKYFADELAARLDASGTSRTPGTACRGFDAMRAGAEAAHRREFGVAENHYRQAEALLPALAAPVYHRALLSFSEGREADARRFCHEAIERDPSYRTPFANSGLAYFRERRFDECARECRRALALDGEDAYAHFGLGRIAALDRQWPEAERWLNQAIALDETIVEAHRALGYVLAQQRRSDEAIAAYDRSLMLTLTGHRPLDSPIASAPPAIAVDTGHCRVHGRVARLYARKGDVRRAIASYRMSLADGEGGPAERWRLASQYAKAHEWTASLAELARGAACAPRELRRAGRWLGVYLRSLVRYHGRLPRLVPLDLS